MNKTEILFSVGMRDNETDEKIHLKVWAENCDEATKKCIVLFKWDACYRWIGTGAVHDENGHAFTREKNEEGSE